MQYIQKKIYSAEQISIKIAEKNANSNQVQVTWFQSDMFKEVEKYTSKQFDIIVSNPPYIETDTIQTLTEEVKQEPYIALDGGKDGLDFYRIIAGEGRKYLKEKRMRFTRNRI